jgi:hypothetical protein
LAIRPIQGARPAEVSACPDLWRKPNSVRPIKPGRSFISSGRSRKFRPAECDYYPRALGYPSGKADQLSVLSCTTRGLSCDPDYAGPGGLLPRHFTLISPRRDGIFSVTLSVSQGLRPRLPALSHGMLLSWCSDFPLLTFLRHNSDRLPTGYSKLLTVFRKSRSGRNFCVYGLSRLS